MKSEIGSSWIHAYQTDVSENIPEWTLCVQVESQRVVNPDPASSIMDPDLDHMSKVDPNQTQMFQRTF